MQANDVPIAIWVTSSLSIPISGKTKTNRGTMIKPPPIPNRPAIKPASNPVSGKMIQIGRE